MDLEKKGGFDLKCALLRLKENKPGFTCFTTPLTTNQMSTHSRSGPAVYMIPVKHLQKSDGSVGKAWGEKCVKHPRRPEQRCKPPPKKTTSWISEGGARGLAAGARAPCDKWETRGAGGGGSFQVYILLEDKHST